VKERWKALWKESEKVREIVKREGYWIRRGAVVQLCFGMVYSAVLGQGGVFGSEKEIGT